MVFRNERLPHPQSLRLGGRQYCAVTCIKLRDHSITVSMRIGDLEKLSSGLRQRERLVGVKAQSRSAGTAALPGRLSSLWDVGQVLASCVACRLAGTGVILSASQALAHEVMKVIGRYGNVTLLRKRHRDLSKGPGSTANWLMSSAYGSPSASVCFYERLARICLAPHPSNGKTWLLTVDRTIVEHESNKYWKLIGQKQRSDLSR